jgi:hypothetical protein
MSGDHARIEENIARPFRDRLRSLQYGLLVILVAARVQTLDHIALDIGDRVCLIRQIMDDGLTAEGVPQSRVPLLVLGQNRAIQTIACADQHADIRQPAQRSDQAPSNLRPLSLRRLVQRVNHDRQPAFRSHNLSDGFLAVDSALPLLNLQSEPTDHDFPAIFGRFTLGVDGGIDDPLGRYHVVRHALESTSFRRCLAQFRIGKGD